MLYLDILTGISRTQRLSIAKYHWTYHHESEHFIAYQPDVLHLDTLLMDQLASPFPLNWAEGAVGTLDFLGWKRMKLLTNSSKCWIFFNKTFLAKYLTTFSILNPPPKLASELFLIATVTDGASVRTHLHRWYKKQENKQGQGLLKHVEHRQGEQ